MQDARTKRVNLRPGFTIRDLVVTLTCMLIATGLLAGLVGANRDLSGVTRCTANLHTWYAGLSAYVSTYNSYPPHNPLPNYAPHITYNGINTHGWDPAQGFIMQYGMGLTPPATTETGHGLWFIADLDEYPQLCFCPSAKFENLFEMNPEIDPYQYEAFLFQYAACYQMAGSCRSATPVLRPTRPRVGGRNPPIADPDACALNLCADNGQGGNPGGVWLFAKTGDPSDPYAHGYEWRCCVQAVHPAEVDDPARVYYMADSRDYRPEEGRWPAAGINDGWLAGYGNKVYLGTRHYGYANAMYLDGHVSRGNQTHIARWNMDYASTGQATSTEWRCATFATDIEIAAIHTQVHIMPVFMIKGWEQIFGEGGLIPR